MSEIGQCGSQQKVIFEREERGLKSQNEEHQIYFSEETDGQFRQSGIEKREFTSKNYRRL